MNENEYEWSHCRCCGACMGPWDHCWRCGCEEREERHQSQHNEESGAREEAHPNDRRPAWGGERGHGNHNWETDPRRSWR